MNPTNIISSADVLQSIYEIIDDRHQELISHNVVNETEIKEKLTNPVITRIAKTYAIDPDKVEKHYQKMYDRDTETTDIRERVKEALKITAFYYSKHNSLDLPKYKISEPKEEDEEVVIPEEMKQKALQRFKDPNLMHNISYELNKSHLSNEKEKLLTFVTMTTSVLPPPDRVSEKVRGETSTGKTNMTLACVQHFPNDWYIVATRITAPSIEDDIKDKNRVAKS